MATLNQMEKAMIKLDDVASSKERQGEEMTLSNRRYDLDWLRVIAFAVLIFYHIGMYYVYEWQWHIKSDVGLVWLQDVMIFTNPWRMALLFFIAGVALAGLMEHRYSGIQLIKLRSKRLFVPLLFGMFFIVVPQVYIEFLAAGKIEPGFIQFWLSYVDPNTTLLPEKHSEIGLLTWNHLWFLPYLWVYSILLVLMASPLQHLAQHKWLASESLFWFILLLMGVLVMIWLALRETFPTTHDLLNDWYNHGKYFLAFVAGFLVFWQKLWWQAAIKQRRVTLLVGICSYAFIIADRHGVFPYLAQAFQTDLAVKLLYGSIFAANIWCCIFAALGYAGRYLNKKSTLLHYCNRAVLTWYILHQTLIVVFAWWIKPMKVPMTLEFVAITTLTVIGCYLGFEVFKRVPILAWLVAIKPEKPKQQ